MKKQISTRLAALNAAVFLAAVVSSACVASRAPPARPAQPRQDATAAPRQTPNAPHWQSIHSEAGARYQFARNLTGHEHAGEMYISFYEHISGRSRVFVKRWTTGGWQDIALPEVVGEQPTNRQKLRSHNGVLYLSFLVTGKRDEHAWHIYRRDGGRWQAVGPPVVYRNFEYGILADDFAFSPSGELYRVWSGDRAVKLEKLDGASWRKVIGMPHSAGFLRMQFDSSGRLMIGVGAPGGRPGLMVKVLKEGALEDMSRGLDHSERSERYHFVKDGGELYLAFRVDVPSRGFCVYRYVQNAWTPVGLQPISYSNKGDSGDSFGFTVYRGRPLLSYRESGMGFIPMVLEYTEAAGWHPLGRPGFFSHNVMTPRLFLFQGRLFLFLSWQDRGTAFLETFQLSP